MVHRMTAEKDTLRRVQDGLNHHLHPALAAFVSGNMKAHYGQNWLHYASRAGGASHEPLDVYGQLKTIIDNWNEVFSKGFDRKAVYRVRGFASMALEARNAVSHLTLPLQDADGLRYLDAMHELAKAVKAPAGEIAALKKLYDEQRGAGIASAPAAPAGAAATAPQLELPAAAAPEPAGTYRPWIEVALPHPDVLANRFKEAEFAADLAAVDAGRASEDYASPESFYRITFLTEGLRRVLASLLERMLGTGGDPVIGLQTSFGGGKTHTMLAAYHLAKATDLARLEGLPSLIDAAGLKDWKRPQVAVFVGTAEGPDVPLNLQNGPKVRTLWGYIAWRLAGQPGLDLVKESEAAGTNPGSALLVKLFDLAGPSLILLDELVAYARQLPDDRFEAFLSFLQSLTEAAKMSPRVMVVGALPEADAEVGGPKGKTALLRLEKIFGRVQSDWMPASGDETYEIIRRRLFQSLDAEGERARDLTIKAFHDLYRTNSAEFPPQAKEARYHELLRLSYPIHPELFDRLSKDWASLEKFQRTRGVLRFMANVVGVLWHQGARDPLITPGRVPIGNDRVRASVLYPLDPAFGAVVDKEVDGEGAAPAQLEANPSRRISQARAATRAARAVFLCSAPLVGSPNAGLTGAGLRLACAEPGDQLALFGEAVRELADSAAYLYEEAGRYWFSTQPTLNRLGGERARAFPAHEVDEAVTAILRDDARHKDRFAAVFAAPDDPAAIDEAAALSLVILGPSKVHTGKGVAQSAATEAVRESLMRCRASQRRYRNTLLFVAPDEAQLAGAREAMRRSMAWASIVEDRRLQQQLTQAQAADATEKSRTARGGAEKAIRAAWSHILYPVKSDATAAGAPFDLEHLSITAKDRAFIPQATYEKAQGDGIAKERLGPETLALNLAPLWQDRPHLPITEVAEWFASYVYLPKLRDRLVLDEAIRDGVRKLDPDFGYADSYDEAAGGYGGLVWGKPAPLIFPASAVIVGKKAALRHLGEAEAAGDAASGLPVDDPGAGVGATAGGEARTSTAAGPQKPRRFFGSVEIDMVRPVKAFEAILNAVIMELQRSPGAKVTLSLDVQVECADGFSDTDVGVVRDNAKGLKFKPESTAFE